MLDVTQKPCLVQTGQGFSLSYQNRFLYSKYAPQKAIVQTVKNLSLLPGTLVLCVSPCLWYGLPELLAMLPANCFVLGLEADTPLYDLARAELEKIAHTIKNAEKGTPPPFPVSLLQSDELLDIVEILSHAKTTHGTELPPLHTFRRAIVLEMSGGAAFYADVYKKIAGAAQNTIASFWKNRLTLTKLGRLFSRNVFHNLALLPRAVPLGDFLRRVDRPIVVFGAGESAGLTLKTIPRAAWQQYFVLAVDAALPVLCAHGIAPDGVVAVESQLAIEKAYIGCTGTQATLFADMASRAQVTAHTAGAISYFASRFSDTHFLDDVQVAGLLPPTVPALGSVGLTATYLALNLRANASVPVYVTGLDFSFTRGATHTRGAPAHIARLCKTNRLTPLANHDAAFKQGARAVQGKSGTVYTDQALSGYAEQFAAFFAGTENLYDCGESGLPLGIARAPLDADEHRWTQTGKPLTKAQSEQRTTRKFLADYADSADKDKKNLRESAGQSPLSASVLNDKIEHLFSQEKGALVRLKDLLMYGEKVRSEKMSVQEEIGAILARREYLYLHFPDGYTCRADDVSFLKRVRSEIDFFLKDITNYRFYRN